MWALLLLIPLAGLGYWFFVVRPKKKAAAVDPNAPLPAGAPLPRGVPGVKGGFGGAGPDDPVTIANKAKIAAMLAMPYDLKAVDLVMLNGMIRLGQKADPTSYDPLTGVVTGNDPSFVIQAKAVRGVPTTDTERAYMAYIQGRSPFRVTNNPDGTSSVAIG